MCCVNAPHVRLISRFLEEMYFVSQKRNIIAIRLDSKVPSRTCITVDCSIGYKRSVNSHIPQE